jgi:Ni/Co efflux regulator RcnB
MSAGGTQAPAANVWPAPLSAHFSEERFGIVTPVRGLPLGVRDELQTLFKTQSLEIAEPGAAFRATDVVLDPNLPIRRLVRAACSIDSARSYEEEDMRRLVAIVLAFSLAAPIAVSAQGKGKNNGKGAEKGRPDQAHVAVVFDDTQRGAVRTYFADTYGRGNCPPGLAKKNNGCLPPGQAKKRYAVGQRLPSAVVVVDLPPALARKIGAPPAGDRFGIVDGDLVKLAVGTMLVVDAIEGLVR